MAARRAQGLPWRAIAEEFGVSDRTARQAVTDHRVAGGTERTGPIDPLAVVGEALETRLWAMRWLRAKADTADNDSAAVGAAKGAAQVGTGLVEMLAQLGQTPAHPAEWLNAQQLNELVAAMRTTVQHAGADWEAVRSDFNLRVAGLPINRFGALSSPSQEAA